MANARSTRTRKAKGTTCHSATREPRLDPEVLARHEHRVMPHGWPPGAPTAAPAAARHRGEGDAPASRLLTGHTPAAHGHDPVGQRDGELRLVRRQQHGRPVGHGVADQLAEQGARGGIEAGVRLVQAARARGGGRAARRARRGAAGRRTAGRPASCAGDRSGRDARAPASALLHGQAEGAHGELDVLRRAEVVVERGGMPQKPDVTAHRGVVRGQIDARGRWPRPTSPAAARRRPAAGWSCRRRWRRPRRRPRPGRETDRPRQGRGSGRRVRPRHESGRQGPWRASPW